jgi:mannose/fructose/N-acetylgalactosamine-specific phosphotransferase system component IIC
MVSRPLVAGVLTGWLLGDPVLGVLIGGILEMYFISIFPVGGSEFPEGGPPTVVAVAVAVSVPGAGGIALASASGLLLSRLGARTIRLLRRMAERLVPDPLTRQVSARRLVWGHLTSIAAEFVRGGVLTAFGLVVGGLLARTVGEVWPLGQEGTLALLAIGAAIPAGALVGGLGGWKKRGIQFGAGVVGFLLAGLVL